MRKPDLYRYFLAFRPDPQLRQWIAALRNAAGQMRGWIEADHLHLTLCILAERLQRDHFLLPRVDAALSGAGLSAFPIRLGRVRGGQGGAALHTVGLLDEYRIFCRALFRHLGERGIVPVLDKKHPHVTIGHQPCRFDPFKALCEWVPGEILLIESEHGLTCHNVLGRWPLLPPPQGTFPFSDPPSWRAASGWR